MDKDVPNCCVSSLYCPYQRWALCTVHRAPLTPLTLWGQNDVAPKQGMAQLKGRIDQTVRTLPKIHT